MLAVNDYACFCVLKSQLGDKRLFGCGNECYLGIGATFKNFNYQQELIPIPFFNDKGIKMVYSNVDITLVIDLEENLYCFGNSNYCNGDHNKFYNLPKHCHKGMRFSIVTTNGFGKFAGISDGKIVVWGRDCEIKYYDISTTSPIREITFNRHKHNLEILTHNGMLWEFDNLYQKIILCNASEHYGHQFSRIKNYKIKYRKYLKFVEGHDTYIVKFFDGYGAPCLDDKNNLYRGNIGGHIDGGYKCDQEPLPINIGKIIDCVCFNYNGCHVFYISNDVGEVYKYDIINNTLQIIGTQ